MILIITLLLKIDPAFCGTECAYHCLHYPATSSSPEPSKSRSHSNSGLLNIHFNIIFSLMPSSLQRQCFGLKFYITCTSLYMLLLSYSSSLYSLIYDEGKLRRAHCCAVSAYLLLGLEPNEYKPH